MRFIDANYDTLLKAERVNNTILTDADSFVSAQFKLYFAWKL